MLSSVHGNFEQQQQHTDRHTFAFIYKMNIILLLLQLKALLGSLFGQRITSHRFWFLKTSYSLAASFGSNANHKQPLRLHFVYIYNNERLVGKKLVQ
jgi:endonuclease/exonuclease/phosphatase (EEP) superfamily protein YafD